MPSWLMLVIWYFVAFTVILAPHYSGDIRQLLQKRKTKRERIARMVVEAIATVAAEDACQHESIPTPVRNSVTGEVHWACSDCWEQIPAPSPPPRQVKPCRECCMDSKLDEETSTWFCMGCGVRLTMGAAEAQHNAWVNMYMPRDWPCTQTSDCDCEKCWALHREMEGWTSTFEALRAAFGHVEVETLDHVGYPVRRQL